MADNDLKDPGVFDGLTAWFSSSVSKHRVKLWTDNDGKLEDVDKAMYIFSENAHAPDTSKIFESYAYLKEHLAVFHAAFVDESVKCKSVADVVIGNYHLKNPQLEADVRQRRSKSKSVEMMHTKADTKADDSVTVTTAVNEQTVQKQESSLLFALVDGYEWIEDSLQVSGPITKLMPGENGLRIVKC